MRSGSCCRKNRRSLSVKWLKRHMTISVIAVSIFSWSIAESEARAKAAAEVLGTRIFVCENDKPFIGRVKFDVPQAGGAILRVVNGAKVGASPHRLEGAEIKINDNVVINPKKFGKNTGILKLRISLVRGSNRLEVRLPGKTGKRLSVRIEAPADAIYLKPVADTLVIGAPLRVQAVLTGLGLPVRDAQIAFNASHLGDVAQHTASTGATGVASATLTGIQLAGTGKLTAKAVGSKPTLLDTVSVQVVETPSIVLEQGMSRTRVELDSEKHVPFFLKFLKDDAKDYHISFEAMEPTGGVVVQTTGVPPGGFKATKPSTFDVQGTIKGRTPGTYTVTSRATIEETGETASASMEVKVVDPEPAEALVLDPPAFVPATITVATPTPVRFAARVSGVSKPPVSFSLELQEFDPQIGWEPVSTLFDDGLDGDMIAGNMVYARRIEVTGAEEGVKRYRVVGSHNGKTVFSDERTLEVSRFFVGPDPRPPVFVEDITTGQKIVAERVIVSILPSVSAERIEEIVEQATQKATGQAGRVGGYTRQINVYRVELVVGPDATEAVRAEAVKAAVAEFETYEEVRYAHPNFLIEFAQVDPDGNSSGDCGADGQWGAEQIQAPEAWALPGGSGAGGTKTVAVVDSGVNNSHPDLTDKVIGDLADLGDDSARPGGHGTKVAGIIAAKHNNVGISGIVLGISGIAHGLPDPIWSFKVGGSFSNEEIVRDKIFEAADTPDVWIINVSTESFTGHADWENAWGCALQYATYPGTTVDPECTGTSSVGKGKLVVVAAGNDEEDISADQKRYPCAFNYDGMLCVANTDKSDHLHSTSNYGAETAGLDLTAPGTNICTTTKTNGYGYTGSNYTGTSLAAPHVAGAAAVLWSMEPDLTAVEVAERLKDTADSIDSVNPAYSGKLGSGRLNLFAAVTFNEPNIDGVPNPPVNIRLLSSTVVWDPNSKIAVMGYRVHVGTASGNYPQKIDVGNVTAFMLDKLPLNENTTSYLAITAYNAIGESDYSNEVEWVIESNDIPAPPAGFKVVE